MEHCPLLWHLIVNLVTRIYKTIRQIRMSIYLHSNLNFKILYFLEIIDTVQPFSDPAWQIITLFSLETGTFILTHTWTVRPFLYHDYHIRFRLNSILVVLAVHISLTVMKFLQPQRIYLCKYSRVGATISLYIEYTSSLIVSISQSLTFRTFLCHLFACVTFNFFL